MSAFRPLIETRVAIVGLGLMGGSLAAALSERHACAHVTGVARREQTISEALDRAIIDAGTLDLATGVRDADLVVLATPSRTIARLVGEAGPLLKAGTVLTDVGSTKEAIVQAMERLPDHVQPVGGHPMCGKEVAGLPAADSGLFVGATYVLTPVPRTSAPALTLVEDLVQAVGARPLVLTASHHDALAAAVSHMPYLASVGLVSSVEGLADRAAWELTASGFKSMSRLAAADVDMALDILLTNVASIREVLARYRTELAGLDGMLARMDEPALRDALSAAARRRRNLYP